MKQKSRPLGRFTRFAIVFLILLVLFMLLLSYTGGASGLFGVYTPWVVAFLIIYVLLMFFLNQPNGLVLKNYLFGRYWIM